jgi:hypothetical protein
MEIGPSLGGAEAVSGPRRHGCEAVHSRNICRAAGPGGPWRGIGGRREQRGCGSVGKGRSPGHLYCQPGVARSMVQPSAAPTLIPGGAQGTYRWKLVSGSRGSDPYAANELPPTSESSSSSQGFFVSPQSLTLATIILHVGS